MLEGCANPATLTGQARQFGKCLHVLRMAVIGEAVDCIEKDDVSIAHRAKVIVKVLVQGDDGALFLRIATRGAIGIVDVSL